MKTPEDQAAPKKKRRSLFSFIGKTGVLIIVAIAVVAAFIESFSQFMPGLLDPYLKPVTEKTGELIGDSKVGSISKKLAAIGSTIADKTGEMVDEIKREVLESDGPKTSPVPRKDEKPVAVKAPPVPSRPAAKATPPAAPVAEQAPKAAIEPVEPVKAVVPIEPVAAAKPETAEADSGDSIIARLAAEIESEGTKPAVEEPAAEKTGDVPAPSAPADAPAVQPESAAAADQGDSMPSLDLPSDSTEQSPEQVAEKTEGDLSLPGDAAVGETLQPDTDSGGLEQLPEAALTEEPAEPEKMVAAVQAFPKPQKKPAAPANRTTASSGQQASLPSGDTISNLIKVADDGNALAQFQLGMRYFNGQGVGQDYAKAAEWVQKAADKGSVAAMVQLGVIYMRGLGVDQDKAKSASWFLRSAEGDSRAGQFNMAQLYRRGEGVEKDEVMAAYWYRRAAEQGLVAAQFNLGLMYFQGVGVLKDPQSAYQWVDKAAEQGDVRAAEFRDYLKSTLPPELIEQTPKP